MKKIIIFLVLIFAVNLYGQVFETQEDSYFGHTRTKMIFSLALGLSSGSANGFLGLGNGFSGDLEYIRLVGRIKPAAWYIKYFFLTMGLSYNLYETDTSMYEIISDQFMAGLGFKMGNKGIWEDITLYLGGGAGFGLLLSRTGLNTGSVNMSDSDGAIYLQNAGIEYKLSDTITFFVEEKYMWGKIPGNDNYIPDKYEHMGGNNKIEPGDTFDRNLIDMSQITMKLGVRLYWGQNLFWFFPFFWEK